MRTAGAGGPVAAAADEAAVGADVYLDNGADVRVAAARGERLTASVTVTLLGRDVGCLKCGGQMLVLAAAVAGAAALLTARPPRWRGGGCVARAAGSSCVARAAGSGVLGCGVGQGVGVVVGFATATVKAVLEETHFGFEVGQALGQLGLESLETRVCGGVGLGLGLGELLFEFGFAEGGAAVKRLVEAGLVTSLPEGLLAGQLAARGGGRDGVEGACFHTDSMATQRGFGERGGRQRRQASDFPSPQGDPLPHAHSGGRMFTAKLGA
jgi:hypothetical protein